MGENGFNEVVQELIELDTIGGGFYMGKWIRLIVYKRSQAIQILL